MEQEEKLFTFPCVFQARTVRSVYSVRRKISVCGILSTCARSEHTLPVTQPAAYLERIHYASSCNVQSTRWRQFEAWSDESDTKATDVTQTHRSLLSVEVSLVP
jgi:hypothetical protein